MAMYTQGSVDTLSSARKSNVKLALATMNTSKDTLGANTRYNTLQDADTTSVANFLSVSLLQHSSPRISFPRAQRFQHGRETSMNSTALNFPSMLSHRQTSIGFGHKDMFPPHHYRNALEYPSPHHYLAHKEFAPKNSRRGRTFGVSYENFQKVFLEHARDYVPSEVARTIPGSGQYQINTQPGQDKPKYTFRQRPKLPKASYEDAPGADHYQVRFQPLFQQRHSDRSMGRGQKYDFTRVPQAEYPGPQYHIPSTFDKYEKPMRRLRLPNKTQSVGSLLKGRFNTEAQ